MLIKRSIEIYIDDVYRCVRRCKEIKVKMITELLYIIMVSSNTMQHMMMMMMMMMICVCVCVCLCVLIEVPSSE